MQEFDLKGRILKYWGENRNILKEGSCQAWGLLSEYVWGTTIPQRRSWLTVPMCNLARDRACLMVLCSLPDESL